MPTRDTHLQTLQRELSQLQDELAALKRGLADTGNASAAMRSDFNALTKEHAQLARAFDRFKTELWLATLRGSTSAAARAEDGMRATIEQQARIQRVLPDRYKGWARVVRDRDVLAARIGECAGRIGRKEEDMHRLRPCGSAACCHCGRAGGAALRRVKGVFRERVARMLRAY